MDISFHYFTIKALALGAGFEESEAQQIAKYSQFVDDYNLFSWMKLSNVPDYAKHLKVRGFFNPVTTGFRGADYAWFLKGKYRRRILTPFHFIPEHQLALKEDPPRVKAYTRSDNNNPLLKSMLIKAKAEYQLSKKKATTATATLMRIGILMHILADTYSHQEFSGGWGWENHSKLVSARTKMDNCDKLGDYNPDFYHEIHSIGHGNVSTAPDDTSICFEMVHKSNNSKEYSEAYWRDNSEAFLKAAHIIYDYLAEIPKEKANTAKPFKQLKESIYQGFLLYTGGKPKHTQKELFDILKKHWEDSLFGTYSSEELGFTYDRNLVLEHELKETNMPVDTDYLSRAQEKSDDFYMYNVVAYDIRQQVTGERDLQSELTADELKVLEELSAKMEFSEET